MYKGLFNGMTHASEAAVLQNNTDYTNTILN